MHHELNHSKKQSLAIRCANTSLAGVLSVVKSRRRIEDRKPSEHAGELPMVTRVYKIVKLRFKWRNRYILGPYKILIQDFLHESTVLQLFSINTATWGDNILYFRMKYYQKLI